MKKWVFGFVVVLLLIGYGAAQHKPKVVIAELPKVVIEEPSKVNHPVQGGTPQKNGHTIAVTKAQIYKGDLLLVNKEHPIPSGGEESEEASLSRHGELVQGFALLDNSIRLSPSLVKKFATMIGAAANDGVNHFIISSGYRDEEKQDELYQQMGPDYALPAGYSEHNLGLSLDIGSSIAEMNRAPEGKWLKNNAWSYGFILRYPVDKTAITGIQFEPWHFRYVGLPHSLIMQAKNMVLEEYLDYLKKKKTITATVNHQTYEIHYYPVSNNTTITVPENGRYEISGNNTDGVIVTVLRDQDA
ncbi:M15 family metallopeptidase [Paenibacillus rhizovicinus]|uniref:M15 family metallopeptidase n=1 Tax=Paenibacillus rhizovicinus TaxID=2704463 RepID=A0A6C0NZE2_9BACL|nr:M15 family metallopeptidase [Paenibacillus rhizovicinus]QHW29842.1 M15 family metallopeptidase [Paenibacillus rhizovicinus]